MMDVQTLADLDLLRESVDVECKLAGGRDGTGALPKDFWPTYSAFANTDGGVVVLGVREKQNVFSVEGIQDVAKIRKDLFSLLNNRKHVSVNLLTDASVREVVLDGKTVMVIEVPRAGRKQRPVHLTTNPFEGNTYRRLNEGDCYLSDDDVKGFLAEQVEDSRDVRVLEGFGLGDLEPETVRAYRQVFANRGPDHPWSTIEDAAFLGQIGAWRTDRETGREGLTLAGLLMFGRFTSIQDELPNYMLDYQERADGDPDVRWTDRITLDGRWSGNLYDFYRRVYPKLTADLKVPFVLRRGERQDETPVHVALREALANVLVHADYSGRASVRVVKAADGFEFRNPGLMRVPAAVAIRGGEPDCRNRTLHQMFRLVGVGEQAGSGIPKIYLGWQQQHWRPPALLEQMEPYDQTTLELGMVDLLPAGARSRLEGLFGSKIGDLTAEERLVLATAAVERVVSHGRIRGMTALPGFEISRILQNIVKKGFLVASGSGRGVVYCLPGDEFPMPEEVFGAGSEHLGAGSEHLEERSEHLGVGEASPGSPDGPQEAGDGDLRDGEGRLVSPHLDAPVIDDLQWLTLQFSLRLKAIAYEPQTKRKLDPKEMRRVLLALCSGHYVTLSCLAMLVDRSPDALRQQYLRPMTREKALRLAFPTAPTHAQQAYRAVEA